MKRIVKINGETQIEESEAREEISSFAANAHKISLKGLPEYEYDKVDKDNTRRKMDYILAYYRKNYVSVERIYNSMISKKNINEIMNDFLYEYAYNYKNKKKRFNYLDFLNETTKLFDKTLYFSIDEIIKKITSLYYRNVVHNMGDKQVSKCMSLLQKGIEPMEFLNGLDIPFTEEAINNGIKDLSAEALAGEIRDSYLLNRTHLCANCPAEIRDCPKLLDYNKRVLSKYEFITDGLQIADDKNQLVKFLVYSCDIYDKAQEAKQKKKTK